MGSCIFTLPMGLGPIPIIYFDIWIVPDLVVEPLSEVKGLVNEIYFFHTHYPLLYLYIYLYIYLSVLTDH